MIYLALLFLVSELPEIFNEKNNSSSAFFTKYAQIFRYAMRDKYDICRKSVILIGVIIMKIKLLAKNTTTVNSNIRNHIHLSLCRMRSNFGVFKVTRSWILFSLHSKNNFVWHFHSYFLLKEANFCVVDANLNYINIAFTEFVVHYYL